MAKRRRTSCVARTTALLGCALLLHAAASSVGVGQTTPAGKTAASEAALAALREPEDELLAGGETKELLQQVQAAIAMAHELYGDKDDPLIAGDLNLAGLCLDTLGRYREGLPMYQAALAMRQ